MNRIDLENPTLTFGSEVLWTCPMPMLYKTESKARIEIRQPGRITGTDHHQV